MALRSKLNSQKKTNAEIEEELEEIGKRMERAKVLFEQYFMGIQKTAPEQLHRELERRIRELTQQQIRNTALRYRFTTLTQKFGSYNTYWKRTLRQIEQGTYVRDVARASRRALRRGEELPEELLLNLPKRVQDRIRRDREKLRARRERAAETAGGQATDSSAEPAEKVRSPAPSNVHQLSADALEDDLDLDSIFSSMMTPEDKPAAAPAAPAAPAVKPPAAQATRPPAAPATKPPRVPVAARKTPDPPAVSPPPGMSEPEARQLYQQYVKARQLVGESTAGVTYDKLMRSLNKQAPKILASQKAKGVTFNVVVKGDKVVLKAKPKKT